MRNPSISLLSNKKDSAGLSYYDIMPLGAAKTVGGQS